MDVTLNTDKKTVNGKEILTWVNDSSYNVDKLMFHLYLNAFKNNKSTFIRESEIEFKKDIKSIELGYCDIISMKILKGELIEEVDLTKYLEFVQPDDDNKDDQTVVQALLPKPIPPNLEVQIEIEFVTKLPKALRRSGYYNDYYFVAQWFPKIGVFWDGEWNCHQYHENSEFFADYGTYDVNLTIPEEYVIGATGEQKKRENNKNGTVTYNYYQECVHDFAWTSSPHFIERMEKIGFSNGEVENDYEEAKIKVQKSLKRQSCRQELRYRDTNATIVRRSMP